MEFAGMTLNGILSDSRSGLHYLLLPDTSVAIVGPNGVGKSSLVKGIQRCVQGDSGEGIDSTLVNLDLLLPSNIENWLTNHQDPGVIKTIRDMLISRESITWRKQIFDVKTEDFIELLQSQREDAVRAIESGWDQRMRWGLNEETANDEYKKQIVQKFKLWKSYISVPFDQVPEDHEKFSKIYMAEYTLNEKGRIEAFNSANAGFNFLITPTGNERTPQWHVDYIIKIAQDELTFENPLTEIAQMLTWPMSLTDAIKHQGQFGFGDSTSNGFLGITWAEEFLNYSIRFINDEAWFGINLGVTQSALGFNFINPDEIGWESVREAAIELIDDAVTFVEEGPSNLAFRLNNQDGQTVQTRLDGNEVGIVPIDPDLSFTKGYSEMASSYFDSFMNGAPRIEFISNRKELWITRGLIEIQVRDGYLTYPLENLSVAQQRWAKIALLLTAYQYSNLALFIDEPERGVQRRIESTLLDIFDNLDVGSSSLPRFFATHSAEIISSCSTVIQISKGADGIRNVRRVVGSIYPLLQEIDISEEEFFQSKKLLVLTEGIMDKAMLDGFAFDRFQKEGIEVISGVGLESWSSYFDSQYLRKSSGAKVVFWADSLDMQKLDVLMQRVNDEKIEDKALVYFLSENIRTVVKESWSKEQYEIVVAIISESLQSKDSKVLIESTGDYDCIMWVTPQILGLPEGVTWPSLIAELNSQPKTSVRESRGKRFKRLVKVKLKSAGIKDGLDIKRLKVLCQELEISGQIPADVDQLINRIIRFARE